VDLLRPVRAFDRFQQRHGWLAVPLPAQLAVSGSALVVPEATKEFVEDDLVGLGAAVDEFRSRLGIR
jgi:hypothetical protein